MPQKSWFKFAPEGVPEGSVYTSPHFGELVVGEAYECPSEKQHLIPEGGVSVRAPKADDDSADGGKE